MLQPIPPRRGYDRSSVVIDLVQREMSNPETQWSLGTFGAIAEFSRDRDEPVRLDAIGG